MFCNQNLQISDKHTEETKRSQSANRIDEKITLLVGVGLFD